MFDFFIALDGHGLNGFEGFAGIARLRCDPDADRWEPEVKFFDGIAGGHAAQLSPRGTVGFLGNLSQQLLFFDPRTLDEVTRCSTLCFRAPRQFYESQTHGKGSEYVALARVPLDAPPFKAERSKEAEREDTSREE